MDKFRQKPSSALGDRLDRDELSKRIAELERKLTEIDESGIAIKESMWSSTIFAMRLELS